MATAEHKEGAASSCLTVEGGGQAISSRRGRGAAGGERDTAERGRDSFWPEGWMVPLEVKPCLLLVPGLPVHHAAGGCHFLPVLGAHWGTEHLLAPSWERPSVLQRRQGQRWGWGQGGGCAAAQRGPGCGRAAAAPCPSGALPAPPASQAIDVSFAIPAWLPSGADPALPSSVL